MVFPASEPSAGAAVAGDASRSCDAALVVSFGGPEGMDEVMPFLEHVNRGRGVPRERLEEVEHHYARFAGVSPINAQNRALVAALRAELGAHGIDLPVYLGNRDWHPSLRAMIRELVQERLSPGVARRSVGRFPPDDDECPAGCFLPGAAPGPR